MAEPTRFPKFLLWLVPGLVVALATIHVIWPSLAIDSTTLGLLAIAALPWLATLLKSFKFAGLEVEFLERRLEQQEAETLKLQVQTEKDRLRIALGAEINELLIDLNDLEFRRLYLLHSDEAYRRNVLEFASRHHDAGANLVASLGEDELPSEIAKDRIATDKVRDALRKYLADPSPSPDVLESVRHLRQLVAENIADAQKDKNRIDGVREKMRDVQREIEHPS